MTIPTVDEHTIAYSPAKHGPDLPYCVECSKEEQNWVSVCKLLVSRKDEEARGVTVYGIDLGGRTYAPCDHRAFALLEEKPKKRNGHLDRIEPHIHLRKDQVQ